MRYALVDGVRQEAQPKLRGACPNCQREVVAKCGQQRIWHWSHLGKKHCDPWWENETEWHRGWKNEFPQECQEVRITGPSGDHHIADVRTAKGTVLEFQHSYLSPATRRTRETFYGQMAWIVDGKRNEKDVEKFLRLLSADIPDYGKMLGWRLPLRPMALVDKWIVSSSPVYLDFGDTSFKHMGLPSTGLLWRIGKASNGRLIVTPFPSEAVISHYKLGIPLEGFDPHPKPARDLWDYRSLD